MALTTASAPVVPEQPGRRSPAARKRRGSGTGRNREGLAGYVFLSPWLLGLMGITAIPMLLSLYLSFTDYSVFSTWDDVEWIGLENYVTMFTNDPSFYRAITVTLVYALVMVPLKLAAALAVALLLNRAWRGVGLFRGLFYLPSLLGGSVALALVWSALFAGDGAVNEFLRFFGITGKAWVNDPDYALGTLIILGIWQFGAPMVIFLAGLKQVPVELYEAASVDGASPARQFWHVTMPMLSPVIFFNLVLETIRGFQSFTSAFVISNGNGGPVDSTLLYTLYLYKRGFTEFDMGYASALAWVFLLAIGILTIVLFSTGRFWVHYADGEDR
ncbi:carbohydrate ABC transporter permease [Catenuloplanes sp. NPDC051500]|uniref:carbohydrate ABC transporter permease n=1 Tax=Catenuloplanes sp. NPDC051500 TaxID=3363959 RepID=UPI0037B82081